MKITISPAPADGKHVLWDRDEHHGVQDTALVTLDSLSSLVVRLPDGHEIQILDGGDDIRLGPTGKPVEQTGYRIVAGPGGDVPLRFEEQELL